ncbi:MAG: pyridoxamine 5'-phosphate oxidase family protein [Gomphosphaeria aponina SAG 52.96 = DSM 107014]|uniref:Pyridoxamine 5'-phosphate oxidase family protein n=1 Tax=Gomphosphaeria aponina SAG 52.96 = DSM 107014 TaxID=1521640 RepID=A0A941GWM5_9CHRO|nr:pyridoxamine 5'-phosphate oxidase family protein [Gomphosphaeria aponina SAG 52.96 = DSM 107014]
MAQFYTLLNLELQSFIQEQKMFFTATAPREGRINLSPKAMDTFRCLNNQTVGYLDLTGSGNETAAHLQENGRMTIMFCSFTHQPLRVIRKKNEEWLQLSPLFPSLPGERQIIILELELIQTSCGYAVPIYEFQSERDTLITWAKNKGSEGIKEYWEAKNTTSIDGMPTHLLEE